MFTDDPNRNDVLAPSPIPRELHSHMSSNTVEEHDRPGGNITDCMIPLMNHVFFLELLPLARYLKPEHKGWFHKEVERYLECVLALKGKL
jgi:hypothetical protein